ncbi:helix-turn-helix domain-containing protein [Actinomadura litoris]|uniref:helix-turn-helix domain-containing protein n=1 Tax=Actinomadura litoris TaxID=2678616 RepID=UPI0035585400
MKCQNRRTRRAGGPLPACSATRLRVQLNTLRYRIRRIADLTGRDLGTLEDRVDFFLAPRATRWASTL